MQVSVETTAGLERRLKIVVPAETFEPQILERLKETAKSVRLNGFRPGKVPIREVSRRFGPSIRSEVLAQVMQSSFGDAVEQEGLSPAGQPNLDVAEPKLFNEAGFDLEYTATFEVMPEVELKPLDDLEIERWQATVSDSDLDTMIENLRTQRKGWETVERAAATGDRLTITFVGSIDGEEFPGGKGEDVPLELGSGSMIDGFESGLEGAVAGDERTLNLAFPEDYRAEELAGKEARFQVTVHTVEASALPALDDAFFETFGVKEGGEEAFRAQVRTSMEREVNNAIQNDVKEQVMAGLAGLHDVALPDALVEGEINRLRQEMLQQIGMVGNDRNPEDILPGEVFKDRAEQRITTGLVLARFVEENDIEADPARVRSMIEEMATGYEDPEPFINYYYGNPQELQRVENAAIENQAVDAMLAKAKVTDVTKTYQEVIAGRPPPAPEAEDSKAADSADDDSAPTAED